MSLWVEYEPRKGYLYVKVTGVFSLEEACQGFRNTLDVVEEHKAGKVLVDCLELAGSPSAADYFAYGAFVAEEVIRFTNAGRGPNPQLAHVAVEPLLDKERLSQLTATNRGANMKTLESVEEALEWLGVEEEGE